MFNLKIGKFKIWIGAEAFGFNPDYFEVSVTHSDQWYDYYIHLAKDDRFPFIDMKYEPNEKLLTAEDLAIKIVEYRSYSHRRDYAMPTWKLHRTTVEKIVERCVELIK